MVAFVVGAVYLLCNIQELLAVFVLPGLLQGFVLGYVVDDAGVEFGVLPEAVSKDILRLCNPVGYHLL